MGSCLTESKNKCEKVNTPSTDYKRHVIEKFLELILEQHGQLFALSYLMQNVAAVMAKTDH